MQPKLISKIDRFDKDVNTILILHPLRNALLEPSSVELSTFFEQIERSLLARIRSSTTEDLIKIQAKVEFLDELEIFIEKIRKSK